MGAPHNIKRYGEVLPEFRIQHGLEILEKLKNKVILSGGWAWHFISEIGHTEYKHAHDHKDIDVFVNKENVAEVVYDSSAGRFSESMDTLRSFAKRRKLSQV